MVSRHMHGSRFSAELPVDFLYAGGSALLLSIARLSPGLWWIYLFALVPFLWRVIRVNLVSSLLLGSLLACCLGFVSPVAEITRDPASFALRLAGLAVLLAMYAALVNRINRLIGINCIFIAFLWLPLELSVGKLLNLDGLLSLTGSDVSIATRLGSLFGLLAISFMIVLVNSIAVLLVSIISDLTGNRQTLMGRDICNRPLDRSIPVDGTLYLLPDIRSPPSVGN